MRELTIVKLYNDFFRTCDGVSIDSRSITKGDLFFALKGPNFDGHKYIEGALGKGAKYAVIQDEDYYIPNKTILVENTEKTLQDLARFHRLTLKIPFIGLTGSNGKTTTKELMACALSSKYKVAATEGNLNNHLGVPLTILSIDETDEIAIIEMGANHVGEIKFLSEIAMPSYGLITNIGKAHLEGFGGIEGVRKGKTELFDYLRKVEGTVFYHDGDPLIVSSLHGDLVENVYSISDIEIIKGFPHLSMRYKNRAIESQLSGEYNGLNILAALTVGETFGVKLESMIQSIETYTPENNRSQIKNTKWNGLILDAYNANPSSMKVSIANLASSEDKKKVLILGHMLELGKSSKFEHEELIRYIQSYKWHKVLLVGEEFFNLNVEHDFLLFKNTDDTSVYLKNEKIEESKILLKGSRGIALENLIPSL